MAKQFASRGDLAEKKVTFTRLCDQAYSYSAGGDPTSGVIVGDDGCMVVDTRSTPVAAQDLIDRIRQVTDKPIRYVSLTHYHAVRVLGASAYQAEYIIASEGTRELIAERGKHDFKSEVERFPRLFQSVESVPCLTWPNLTISERMTIWLGSLEVQIMQLGKGHSKGDTIAWLPKRRVLFSRAGLRRREDLKQVYARTYKAMAKDFGGWAIFDHCMPFDVARCYDEVSGIEHPRIWTAKREIEMWKALEG